MPFPIWNSSLEISLLPLLNASSKGTHWNASSKAFLKLRDIVHGVPSVELMEEWTYLPRPMVLVLAFPEFAYK